MFDLGFIKDIRFLLRRLPSTRKNAWAYCSQPPSPTGLPKLAYEHMNNPRTIEVEPDKVTADKVQQTCYMAANEEKIPLLIGLMNKLQPPRSIVFVNTKRTADTVWGYLEGNGFKTAVLSGDVPQRKRMKLLLQFQSGELPILVATDVAARGLHIPDVSHIFNYDLPEDAEDYVHRIGRTARAGASGEAISFACETYAFSLPDIEEYIGHRLPMDAVQDDLLAEVDPKSRVRPERHDRQRPGKRNDRNRRSGQGKPRNQRKGPEKKSESQQPADTAAPLMHRKRNAVAARAKKPAQKKESTEG